MSWRRWFGGRVRTSTGEWDLSHASLDLEQPEPLDLWHIVLGHAFGSQTLAPVRHPLAILDVACGTGRWARDLARKYPDARVVGFDLDQSQIDRVLEAGAWRGDDLLPANCRLGKGDALSPFPFSDGNFDYTHLRLFSSFLPAGRVLQVLSEMRRVTHRGGWVELLDASQIQADDSAVQYLLNCLRQLYAANGLALEPGKQLGDHLRQSGLTKVSRRLVTLRATGAAEDASSRLVHDLISGVISAADEYVRLGIAGQEQVAASLDHVRAATRPPTLQVELCAAWGCVP